MRWQEKAEERENIRSKKDQLSTSVWFVKLIILGKFLSQKGILFIGTDSAGAQLVSKLICATFLNW